MSLRPAWRCGAEDADSTTTRRWRQLELPVYERLAANDIDGRPVQLRIAELDCRAEASIEMADGLVDVARLVARVAQHSQQFDAHLAPATVDNIARGSRRRPGRIGECGRQQISDGGALVQDA